MRAGVRLREEKIRLNDFLESFTLKYVNIVYITTSTIRQYVLGIPFTCFFVIKVLYHIRASGMRTFCRCSQEDTGWTSLTIARLKCENRSGGQETVGRLEWGEGVWWEGVWWEERVD